MERIILAFLTISTLDRMTGYFDSLYRDDVYGRSLSLGRHVIMLLWVIAVCGEVVWLRVVFLDS